MPQSRTQHSPRQAAPSWVPPAREPLQSRRQGVQKARLAQTPSSKPTTQCSSPRAARRRGARMCAAPPPSTRPVCAIRISSSLSLESTTRRTITRPGPSPAVRRGPKWSPAASRQEALRAAGSRRCRCFVHAGPKRRDEGQSQCSPQCFIVTTRFEYAHGVSHTVMLLTRAVNCHSTVRSAWRQLYGGGRVVDDDVEEPARVRQELATPTVRKRHVAPAPHAPAEPCPRALRTLQCVNGAAVQVHNTRSSAAGEPVEAATCGSRHRAVGGAMHLAASAPHLATQPVVPPTQQQAAEGPRRAAGTARKRRARRVRHLKVPLHHAAPAGRLLVARDRLGARATVLR